MKEQTKLLYFTMSYPYGLGEKWKEHELEVLKEHFEDITVIPFHYGNNFNHPRPAIPGIKYHPPLFRVFEETSFFPAIIAALGSPHLLVYMKDFLRNNVWVSRKKFRRWWVTSKMIEDIRRHPFIKKYLFESEQSTIAYFFWGKRTSQVIPLLKNNYVKTVCRFHGFDLYAYRFNPPYLPYQSQMIAAASKVLLISDDGKAYLSKLYTEHSDKMQVNRLGTQSKGRANASKDEVLRIFSCSSVIPLKRIGLILESLFHTPSGKKVSWTHIGDGPLLEDIKNRAKNLPSNVEAHFTGWINSDFVLDHYLRSPVDLFINVSETEGVPVSIMEAMSAGIPVIATDVGGTSEIVNERNGTLVDPAITAQELTLKIMEFTQLPKETLQQKREAAFLTYSDHYDSYKNAHRLAKILKEL